MRQPRRVNIVLAASNPTGRRRGERSNECCVPGCHGTAQDEDIPLCFPCGVKVAGRYWSMMPGRASAPVPKATERRLDQPGRVYFIRLGNAIKIGFSTDVQRRLLDISHEEILATMPGTMRDEKALHKRFAHHRLVNEWFADHEDIRAYLAELNTTTA